MNTPCLDLVLSCDLVPSEHLWYTFVEDCKNELASLKAELETVTKERDKLRSELSWIQYPEGMGK